MGEKCQVRGGAAFLAPRPNHLAQSSTDRPTLRTLNGFLTKSRAAMTLIELLVVISIIGMLMAILLPAVMGARASARQVHCANNMRNVALALLNEAEAKGRFPASGYFGTSGTKYRSWVVTLLPWIERRDLSLLWDLNQPMDAAPNDQLARTSIEILTCPSDDTLVSGEGNLSFVVNGGFGFTIPTDCPANFSGQPIDLNGNGIILLTPNGPDGSPTDRELYARTGLFFLANWPPSSGSRPRSYRSGSIPDGTGYTILLTENVRAGFDPYSNANWSWPDPRRHSFFVSSRVCANLSCSAANVDYAMANHGSTGESINSGLDKPEGEAPWPNSHHTGGVQMVFADGHLSMISEDIEGSVYAALVSPNGLSIEGPLAQRLVSDWDY